MEQEISKELLYLTGSTIIGTVSLITVAITSFVTFKVSNKNNLALQAKEIRSKRIDKLQETLTCFNEYYSKVRLTCSCIIAIKSLHNNDMLEMYEESRNEAVKQFFKTMNLIELNCDLKILGMFLEIDKKLEETAGMISNVKDKKLHEETSKIAKDNLIDMHKKAIKIKKAIRDEYQDLMSF
ncbi:hypothetical protein [Pseudoalteromonas sp.]|uniref:hypothetical protein n=1 Tax=Pseudoalteromonas sp. TaxID=53249 RepID=UPI003518B43F